MALGPGIAAAEPLGTNAIANQVEKGWNDWKAAMQDLGWTGLQPRIAHCFKQLSAKPTQERTVYCATLDHLTLLDTMNFPVSLRPPFFATDSVFARLDTAVAQSTPKGDRRLFESRLLSTMDETIHHLNETQGARTKGRWT